MIIKVKGTSFEFILDLYDVDDQNRVIGNCTNILTFKTNFTLMVKVTSFKHTHHKFEDKIPYGSKVVVFTRNNSSEIFR